MEDVLPTNTRGDLTGQLKRGSDHSGLKTEDPPCKVGVGMRCQGEGIFSNRDGWGQSIDTVDSNTRGVRQST